MYRVSCHSCERPFDAEKAPECNCLHPVRSFRCPHCAACFCNASREYIRAFWKGAPPDVWARRKARQIEEGVNEPPELIVRPMVLFADDDPLARSVARQVVGNLGFGVVIAEDGEMALRLAREYRPDLFITDALMPKLDGRDAAHTLRQEMPEMKIVVITSVYKDRRYKIEAHRKFAVDEYIEKPVRPGDLRELVRKYLA